MDLYFIRHGQSANNVLWGAEDYKRARVADPKLTAIGEQQAQACAAYLAAHGDTSYKDAWDPQNAGGFKFTHIYCSLMERAVQTADPIAAAYDLPLMGWEEAHEYGGLFAFDPVSKTEVGVAGLSKADFASAYPRLNYPASSNAAGWWNYRDKEPLDQSYARSQLFMQQLLEKHGDTNDQVVVVSHAGFINYALEATFGTKILGTQSWMLLNNTSLTRLHFNDSFKSVFYLNRISHLSTALITS